jgi:hypothetical protein
LDGRADGDVADLDVVRLLDGKGDGAGDGVGGDGELIAAAADLLSDFVIVDGVGEVGAARMPPTRPGASGSASRPTGTAWTCSPWPTTRTSGTSWTRTR